MEIDPDYKDLLKNFNDEGVEYLLVGGLAVGYHTQPRYTKDMEVWVGRSPTNADRIFRALIKFGAPLKNISAKDFLEEDIVYQIGVAPHRIDVLTHIPGVTFSEAWDRRIEEKYEDERVAVIAKEDLIAAKKASARDQDLLDAKNLARTDER